MTNHVESVGMLSVAGNDMRHIAAVFGVILASLIAGRVARYLLDRAGKRFEGGRELLAVSLHALARGAVFLLFAFGLDAAIDLLVLGDGVRDMFGSATHVLGVLAVGYVAYCLVDAVDHWMRGLAGRRENGLDRMLVPMVRKSLRATIVVLVLVQVAQALSDRPITSIIAGLGVGGLAIALAAQETIKNFFGSLVILADKPFALGDRLVVDGHDGPVEHVGMRSTRIRTLEGHLVTIPNGELANKTIQNIGKRPYIRRLMNVTITYDTPPEKVERAVQIVKELLDNHEGMRPDFPPRVYFSDFNSASLNLLVIYWYHPPDYWAFQAFNERFNLELLRRFNAEGIEFAFPTQTLYLAGDAKRPLKAGT